MAIYRHHSIDILTNIDIDIEGEVLEDGFQNILWMTKTRAARSLAALVRSCIKKLELHSAVIA